MSTLWGFMRLSLAAGRDGSNDGFPTFPAMGVAAGRWGTAPYPPGTLW
ncbi:hypothetical protein ACSNOE_24200 [Streptomyces radiopugnans]